MGGQAEPVQLDQADAARQRLLQVPPALQAGPLQVDERLRIAPLMRLGDQQAGRAAGGARAEPAGLDQQHLAEAGLRAGGGGAHAEDAAADDQYVRPAPNVVIGAAQHGTLLAVS